MRLRHLLITLSLVLALFLLLMAPYLLAKPSPVLFNQHYIEHVLQSHGAAPFGDRLRTLHSSYTFARTTAFLEVPVVNRTDPASVFDYVYANLPSYAIVYPSEMYYYFQLPIDDEHISGNLRLVEADNGYITIGYFGIEDTALHGVKELNASTGLSIRQRPDGYTFRYEGKTVRFRIAPPPPDRTLALEDGEELVSPILDESGVYLSLIHNTKTRSFYYLLNQDIPLTEDLVPIGDRILKGERTDFVYYDDETHSRRILFGVAASHVRANDYFDGPFDQVPPRLDLREKIYSVYPYTQLEGVDEHGNFLRRSHTRIAISPYLHYYNITETLELAQTCENFTDTLLWSCLTYERKQDFHKESPLFYENGTLKNATSLER